MYYRRDWEKEFTQKKKIYFKTISRMKSGCCTKAEAKRGKLVLLIHHIFRTLTVRKILLHGVAKVKA